METSRTILILTAGFGNGHHAAARGLREALETRAPQTQVAVLDLFQLSYGRAFDGVARLFLGVVRHAPFVWKEAYRLFDHPARLDRLLARLRKPRAILRRFLEETDPAAVVSTHPAYAHVWGQLRLASRASRAPFLTVVTDVRPTHAAWRHAASDAWIVPDAETAEEMAAAGIPRPRVHATGFPVSPRFAALAARKPRNPEAPLRVLWIPQGDRRRIRELFDGLLAATAARLTVLCGRDAALRADLRARARDARVAVFGWATRMPELLAAHHLAITKAGGAIVQECLAARCVPLINHVVPGQEEGNARLVARLGLGEVCFDPSAVIATVNRAAADQGAAWRRWQAALERHRRPDAARRAAEVILRATVRRRAGIERRPAPTVR